MDDEEMLDWLTDPNVMEISDQIEKVQISVSLSLTLCLLVSLPL